MAALRVLLAAVTVVESQMHTYAVHKVNNCFQMKWWE